jgi:hypothetical protein
MPKRNESNLNDFQEAYPYLNSYFRCQIAAKWAKSIGHSRKDVIPTCFLLYQALMDLNYWIKSILKTNGRKASRITHIPLTLNGTIKKRTL